MGRHRADGERASAHLDACQPVYLGEIDQVLGTGKPQLHGRNKRMAAGKELCFLLLGEQARRLA